MCLDKKKKIMMIYERKDKKKMMMMMMMTIIIMMIMMMIMMMMMMMMKKMNETIEKDDDDAMKMITNKILCELSAMCGPETKRHIIQQTDHWSEAEMTIVKNGNPGIKHDKGSNPYWRPGITISTTLSRVLEDNVLKTSLISFN